MTHVAYALAHPIFDPDRDMARGGFHWSPERLFYAGLTANIGME